MRSPLELDLSLRAPSLSPGLPAASPTKGAAAVQAPLLRSLPLQRLRIEASTYRGRLPQPLRSALAVSHDLDGLLRFDPFRGLPRIPLMGFFPPGLFPSHRGPRRLRHNLPSWPSSQLLPPSRGRVASPCYCAGPPGSYSCDSTVSASFWFPIHRGPSPSWVSTFWNLASLRTHGFDPARPQGRPAPSPVPN